MKNLEDKLIGKLEEKLAAAIKRQIVAIKK